jgi:RimJ/RimL family protein N-acetyltransferase
LWLVVDRASGDKVGQVGLAWQDVEGRRLPEIGWLVRRAWWRRGIATEAAIGVRDNAFTEHGLDRVISLIRPVNEPSQGVARKVGMHPVREVDFHGYRHIEFAVARQ